MKHSPLQLIRYFVTACACNANPKYDPQKEIVGGLEQFSVEVKATPLEPTKDLPGHHWSVEMAVVQKINEGQNFPYTFHITMEGMYACKDGVLKTEAEIQFVKVNGSSMLYGIAREQIRALTAAGPWGAIIIPTLSFYEKQPDVKDSTPAKAQ
jgi:preprotein translocase subunit SecB